MCRASVSEESSIRFVTLRSLNIALKGWGLGRYLLIMLMVSQLAVWPGLLTRGRPYEIEYGRRSLDSGNKTHLSRLLTAADAGE
jgi:hypothetical protein